MQELQLWQELQAQFGDGQWPDQWPAAQSLRKQQDGREHPQARQLRCPDLLCLRCLCVVLCDVLCSGCVLYAVVGVLCRVLVLRYGQCVLCWVLVLRYGQCSWSGVSHVSHCWAGLPRTGRLHTLNRPICTNLHYSAPLCVTLHYSAPLCTTLHHSVTVFTMLHHSLLYYTTLQCSSVGYIADLLN